MFSPILLICSMWFSERILSAGVDQQQQQKNLSVLTLDRWPPMAAAPFPWKCFFCIFRIVYVVSASWPEHALCCTPVSAFCKQENVAMHPAALCVHQFLLKAFPMPNPNKSKAGGCTSTPALDQSGTCMEPGRRRLGPVSKSWLDLFFVTTSFSTQHYNIYP